MYYHAGFNHPQGCNDSVVPANILNKVLPDITKLVISTRITRLIFTEIKQPLAIGIISVLQTNNMLD
jgi:hypothetical protein